MVGDKPDCTYEPVPGPLAPVPPRAPPPTPREREEATFPDAGLSLTAFNVVHAASFPHLAVRKSILFFTFYKLKKIAIC